ncbi:MAG: hypothetical protein AAFY76_16540, partial [Cyanobacteria bacterium J06649_11]
MYEVAGDDASALMYRKLAFAQCSDRKPEQYFRELLNVAGFNLDLRQEAGCWEALSQAKAFALANNLRGSRYWAMYYATLYEYYNLRPALDSMTYALDQQLAFYARYPHWKNEGDYPLYLNQRAGIHIRRAEFNDAQPYVMESLGFTGENEHFNTSAFLLSKIRCGNGNYPSAISILHQLICLAYAGEEACSTFPMDTVLAATDFTPSFTLIEYIKDKASYYQYWYAAQPSDHLLALSNIHVNLADDLLNIMREKGRYRGSSRRIDEISAELRKVEIDNLYATQSNKNDPEIILQAFNSSEKVKQFTISQRLHGQLMKEQDFGLPDHIVEKERKYINELTDLINQQKTAPDSVALNRLVGRMDTVKADQLILQQLIAKEYPEYHSLLFSPEPLSLAEIRRDIIGQDEVLLQYLD